MNRISKPPEIRRRELLEAAAELFLRKGYEATSIRDILAKVGGQPGMFYYYFASKAEIFRAAMDAYTEGYVQGVVTILARRDRPVAARFREALDLAVKSLAKFNVAIDQGASVDRVGLADRYCTDFMNRLVEPSAALLREADPARGEEETRAQARFFLYGVYGLMHDPLLGGREADLSRVAESVLPLAGRILDFPAEQWKGV